MKIISLSNHSQVRSCYETGLCWTGWLRYWKSIYHWNVSWGKAKFKTCTVVIIIVGSSRDKIKNNKNIKKWEYYIIMRLDVNVKLQNKIFIYKVMYK